MDKWISVKERLPDTAREVLAGAWITAKYINGNEIKGWQVALQCWRGEKWIDSDTGEEDGATHWQELPTPPDSNQ